MGVHSSLSKPEPEPTGLRSEPLRATKSGRLVTSDVVTVRSDHISPATFWMSVWADQASPYLHTFGISFVCSVSYAACSLF